ncbi:uncharacterized protein LOC123891909 [Trifolium pratense]|uniref:uncharacterized protein LOC123891909 n=1 Tax=Trifolium pratense TaxID=57577 RepID=UPI001E68FE56|nr:uncharacterized protein LOC123891909 [Trifolium pratense]
MGEGDRESFCGGRLAFPVKELFCRAEREREKGGGRWINRFLPCNPITQVLLYSRKYIYDFADQFNNVPIPSLDFLFNDDLGDLEITFDDLDNLCIPSDTEEFLLPDSWNPNGVPISPIIDNEGVVNFESPESGASVVSGDQSPDVSRFLNSDSVSADDNDNSVDVDVKVSMETEYHHLWSNSLNAYSLEKLKAVQRGIDLMRKLLNCSGWKWHREYFSWSSSASTATCSGLMLRAVCRL